MSDSGPRYGLTTALAGPSARKTSATLRAACWLEIGPMNSLGGRPWDAVKTTCHFWVTALSIRQNRPSPLVGGRRRHPSQPSGRGRPLLHRRTGAHPLTFSNDFRSLVIVRSCAVLRQVLGGRQHLDVSGNGSPTVQRPGAAALVFEVADISAVRSAAHAPAGIGFVDSQLARDIADGDAGAPMPRARTAATVSRTTSPTPAPMPSEITGPPVRARRRNPRWRPRSARLRLAAASAGGGWRALGSAPAPRRSRAAA